MIKKIAICFLNLFIEKISIEFAKIYTCFVVSIVIQLRLKKKVGKKRTLQFFRTVAIGYSVTRVFKHFYPLFNEYTLTCNKIRKI